MGSFFAWGNMQTGPETRIRVSMGLGLHVSLHNQGWSILLTNHFSMPEKREMEYVPVGIEARTNRSRGLRFVLERLLLRLFRHSCVCPLCFRLRGNAAQEKVIEF